MPCKSVKAAESSNQTAGSSCTVPSVLDSLFTPDVASDDSVTPALPAADAGVHLRGNRHNLLSRIIEGTNNRSSFHTMPPTPPASSRPTSMAESSRPTSLLSEPAEWRPLPVRPSSRGASTVSNTSTRTVRPSLFDLLVSPRTPPSPSTPRLSRLSPGAEVRDLSSDVVPLPTSHQDRARLISWNNVKSVSEALDWHPPPRPLNVSPPTLPVPPPPILFSRFPADTPGQSSPHNTMKNVKSSSSSGACLTTPPAGMRSAQDASTGPVRFHAQPAQVEQATGQDSKQHMGCNLAIDDSKPLLAKPEPCCSVSEAKAEVKALMDQFKRDFERTMVRTFGKDWDKPSPTKADTALPYIPSPVTCASGQVPFDLPTTGRDKASFRPPLPPLPLLRPSYGFPPPPPRIPPPPLLVPPPPPPPCFAPPPPPPPPPLPFITSMSFNRMPGPCRSPVLSSCDSTPPMRGLPSLPPPPIPAVALNPTQPTHDSKWSSFIPEQRSDDEIVHSGITCDSCGKRDIRGIRYKCLQCPGMSVFGRFWDAANESADYDWCSVCITLPETWEAHLTGHAFYPIRKKADFVLFCLAKDRRSHAGIACDGCHQKNLTGVRHRCLQCAGMFDVTYFTLHMLISFRF